MKRLWIGVGLMVIVISCCVWGQITVRTACDKITKGFSETLEMSENGDFDSAMKSAKQVQKQWLKYHSRLSALKNHDELHDLILDVNVITDNIEGENLDEITETCNDATVRLKHIKDGEKITFGNIF